MTTVCTFFSVADTVGGSPSKTPSQLPFQVQIDYSASDGSHYLKVITRAQPVTTKKVEAERGECSQCTIEAHACSYEKSDNFIYTHYDRSEIRFLFCRYVYNRSYATMAIFIYHMYT